MFFVYALALVGLLALVGAGIGLAVGWLDEPAELNQDPYQAAIEAAGHIQEEAWIAIQRLHELRVDGRADVIDGPAAEEPAHGS